MSVFVVFDAHGRKLLPNLREAKKAARAVLRECQANPNDATEVVPIYRLGRCGANEYLERVGGVCLVGGAAK
jgi:hypothetical protein